MTSGAPAVPVKDLFKKGLGCRQIMRGELKVVNRVMNGHSETSFLVCPVYVDISEFVTKGLLHPTHTIQALLHTLRIDSGAFPGVCRNALRGAQSQKNIG